MELKLQRVGGCWSVWVHLLVAASMSIEVFPSRFVDTVETGSMCWHADMFHCRGWNCNQPFGPCFTLREHHDFHVLSCWVDSVPDINPPGSVPQGPWHYKTNGCSNESQGAFRLWQRQSKLPLRCLSGLSELMLAELTHCSIAHTWWESQKTFNLCVHKPKKERAAVSCVGSLHKVKQWDRTVRACY